MRDALATHYAQALADSILTPVSGISPERAVEQFREAEMTISGSADLQMALASPAVKKSRKIAIMSELAGKLGLDRLLRNFLLVVTSHRRTDELPQIRAEFERLVDERLGWIPAEIASAQELTGEQRSQIERSLGDRLNKRIRPHYQVDRALLGGVRIRVASREYDASLRGKLEAMRRELVGSL